jgi:hypothetical protein
LFIVCVAATPLLFFFCVASIGHSSESGGSADIFGAVAFLTAVTGVAALMAGLLFWSPRKSSPLPPLPVARARTRP